MTAVLPLSTCRYEWMYAQVFINWSQPAAEDPDSLHFRLDPNGHQAVRYTARFRHDVSASCQPVEDMNVYSF
jgi:hypothetical protein